VRPIHSTRLSSQPTCYTLVVQCRYWLACLVVIVPAECKCGEELCMFLGLLWMKELLRVNVGT